jgi:hypothetical protein
MPSDDVALAADGAPAAPAPESTEDAVKRALEATVRAEDVQRQLAAAKAKPPAPKTVDEAIDQLPLSDFWKGNMRAHPQLIDPANGPVVGYYVHRALKSGINMESPQMLDAVLGGLKSEAEMTERAEQLARPPRPFSDDAEIERMALETEREAEALQNPTPPKPVMPSARRMPVSAPVSREAPSISTGRPQSFSTSVTLSPAEREIARNSFSDPSMSAEEKERSYAMQKRRMLIARANGTLNE